MGLKFGLTYLDYIETNSYENKFSLVINLVKKKYLDAGEGRNKVSSLKSIKKNERKDFGFMTEERNQKRKMNSNVKNVGCIICFVCFLIFVIIGSIGAYTMYQDIQKMKSEITTLNELKKSMSQQEVNAQEVQPESIEGEIPSQEVQVVNVTQGLDAQYTLDFIENEVSRYREFIESQQQFLIWLVGIVATGAVSLLTFLGYKSRNDIDSLIQEEYISNIDNKVEEITETIIEKQFKDKFERNLGELIGGEEKVEYLQENIEREKASKSKNIVFVYNEKIPNQAMEAYQKLLSLKYMVKLKPVDWNTGMNIRDLEMKIDKTVDRNDLLIFLVNQSELKNEWKKIHKSELIKQYGDSEEYEKAWKKNQFESEDSFLDKEFGEHDKDLCYYKVSQICEEKNICCILYAEGGNTLTNKCYKHFYTQMANTGMTLIERVFLVLNLK